VALCPVCKTEASDAAQSCVVCGFDFSAFTDGEWMSLGYIEDKVHADLAREVLKDAEIPAVIISKSGFFGDLGLPLHPFYGGSSSSFEVWTPMQCADEAVEMLDMTLGDKWRRQDQ